MKLRSRLDKFFGWVMTCKQIVNCRLNIPKHVLSINFIVVNIFVLRDVYMLQVNALFISNKKKTLTFLLSTCNATIIIQAKSP